ncbi:MAG: hypothetical protein GX564_00885 [Oligosphaeraceae bacterium]|nr:hypothetical protein [Oligosphaeraceae bacterium]
MQSPDQDNIDDSHCLVPTEEHREFSPWELVFKHYADGLLFSRNLIMLVPEQKLIRLPNPFAILGCLDGRFVVGHYTDPTQSPGLVIGVLKERHLLAR